MKKLISKVADGLLITVGRQFACVFHGTAYGCSICGPHRQKFAKFGSWSVVDFDRHNYDVDIRGRCHFRIYSLEPRTWKKSISLRTWKKVFRSKTN